MIIEVTHAESIGNDQWKIPPLEKTRRGDVLMKGSTVWVVIIKGVLYDTVVWVRPSYPSRLTLSRLRVFERKRLIERWKNIAPRPPIGMMMRTGNILIQETLPIDADS